MKSRIVSSLLSTVVAVCVAQGAFAEVNIKLSKMHLCCGACEKAVQGAVDKIEGAAVEIDADAGTVVVTAADAKTVRKAIGAVGRAGFHGVSDHKKIKMPENSGVKAGKVKRLELVGVHNCCGGCNSAIKKAIATVDGVEADTAKPKAKTLVVEGEFDGLAVVTALNKAGFHVRAKGAWKAKKKAAEEKAAKTAGTVEETTENK